MRPVNLIPPERRRGDRAPARTGVIPYVLLAGVGLAVVAVSLMTVVGKQIADREARVASVEAEAAATESQAQALAPYAEFAELEAVRTLTVTGLARSRFDWERVMRELALVIPEDVALTSLSGAASAESGVEAATPTGLTGPSLTIVGCASGHEAVARFVGALEDVDGVTRVGIQSSAKGSNDDAGGGGDCGAQSNAHFEALVAFDNAAVAATAVDPAALAPLEDASGVEAAKAETGAAAASAGEQSEKATKAANLIPGVAR